MPSFLRLSVWDSWGCRLTGIRDADALTAAFKEFSAKKLTQEQKPSIRKLIVSLKEKAAALNAQREKVKNKDRGIAR